MKGRYNITLSIDMDERLNQFAYQTRKSRSSIIEDALNQYLPGPKELPSIIHNDGILYLKEHIEFIESNIRDLESTIHIICVKIDSKESTKPMDIAI